MYDSERFFSPFRSGKHWYHSYNEGLKNQSVLYTLDEKTLEAGGMGEVFFDPNTLSEDGTISV
jgi:prolyl oligopeptidase